eukprot:g7730.t1
MPSIAGFIQSLLSEDMYATGMLEKTDERISQLNAGQLRLLLSFVENKLHGLTNKTVLDAYTKLLQKATAEANKRHEEEVRGERERLSKLKAAHAGVNAKAWDTSHASLDRELAKFQKFLKSKARRVAEEEVLQEEMEKLHSQLLALPARRVAADTKKHTWWAFGAVLVVVVGPILVLSLVSVGTLVALGAFLAACVLAFVCWFVGMLRGTVVAPTLNDDDIEEKTRKRARETLKGYRAEVRQTFEATEKIFAADMKWRDEWVERRKKERRDERRKAKKALTEGEERAEGAEKSAKNINGGRIFPEEGGESCTNSSPGMVVAPTTEDGGGSSARAARAEGETRSRRRRVLAEEEGRAFSADLSGAHRQHNAEGDEGFRGAKEGLLARPPGKQATASDPGAPEGESAGTVSPGARRRRSTPSDGRRHGASGNPESFAGAEEGSGGVERGPCQGSGLLGVSRQGLEKQCRQESFGADPPPSVSDVGATDDGASSLVPVPGEEAGGVTETDGSPRRAKGHPGRTD